MWVTCPFITTNRDRSSTPSHVHCPAALNDCWKKSRLICTSSHINTRVASCVECRRSRRISSQRCRKLLAEGRNGTDTPHHPPGSSQLPLLSKLCFGLHQPLRKRSDPLVPFCSPAAVKRCISVCWPQRSGFTSAADGNRDKRALTS